jgi:hypothetical protein
MDQIEKKKSQVTEKNLNSSPNCINQSIILAEKRIEYLFVSNSISKL